MIKLTIFLILLIAFNNCYLIQNRINKIKKVAQILENKSQVMNEKKVNINVLTQKDDLAGNAQEGFQGIQVIEKMIADLREKTNKLFTDAKAIRDSCIAKQDALQCQNKDTWKNQILSQKKNIDDKITDSNKQEVKIKNYQDQKKIFIDKWQKSKEEAQKKTIESYQSVIIMIQKIIRIMVKQYNVTTNQNLDNLPAFISIEQDLKDINAFKSDNSIYQTVLLQFKIRQDKYQKSSAQKFVQLMEILIAKLQNLQQKVKTQFQFSDTSLNNDLAQQDAQIKTANQSINDNNLAIQQINIDIQKLNDQINKCKDDQIQRNACKDNYQVKAQQGDQDNELLSVLVQVLLDTKKVMGILDDCGLYSALMDDIQTKWITTTLQNRPNINKVPKFKLLYKGSVDGFNMVTLKSKVATYDQTLTIYKAAQTNKVFGGYFSKSNNGQTGFDDQYAFVFSASQQQVRERDVRGQGGNDYTYWKDQNTWGLGEDMYSYTGYLNSKNIFVACQYGYTTSFNNCNGWYSDSQYYGWGLIIQDIEIWNIY